MAGTTPASPPCVTCTAQPRVYEARATTVARRASTLSEWWSGYGDGLVQDELRRAVRAVGAFPGVAQHDLIPAGLEPLHRRLVGEVRHHLDARDVLAPRHDCHRDAVRRA